jgi:hypothetical protein
VGYLTVRIYKGLWVIITKINVDLPIKTLIFNKSRK